MEITNYPRECSLVRDEWADQQIKLARQPNNNINRLDI